MATCPLTPPHVPSGIRRFLNLVFELSGNNPAIRETYLKNSNNIFNATRLEHVEIHDEPVLKDTEAGSFALFETHTGERFNFIIMACIRTESKQQLDLLFDNASNPFTEQDDMVNSWLHFTARISPS